MVQRPLNLHFDMYNFIKGFLKALNQLFTCYL